MRLTKLQFVELLGEAYVNILAAAKQSPVVDAWYQKFMMASVEPDGTSIDTSDPRTIAGINDLVAGGLMTQEQANHVLDLQTITFGDPHSLLVYDDNENEVVFKCVVCGKECGFSKSGEPAPVAVGESWAPPEQYETWMGPCIN